MTQVGPWGAVSGFANTPTIAIVAMYVLSADIQRTGLVQRLGPHLAAFTRGNGTLAKAVGLAALFCAPEPTFFAVTYFEQSRPPPEPSKLCPSCGSRSVSLGNYFRRIRPPLGAAAVAAAVRICGVRCGA